MRSRDTVYSVGCYLVDWRHRAIQVMIKKIQSSVPVLHSLQTTSTCVLYNCVGEGGRDPLPLTGSLRRPMSGVLNTFALKSMPFRTPTGAYVTHRLLFYLHLVYIALITHTSPILAAIYCIVLTVRVSAMEPEIGFLMANLAGVGPNSRILDPYCGCCSLLLAAAYLQRLQPPHSDVLEHSVGERERPNEGEGENEGECGESSRPCLVGVDSCLGADLGPIHANFASVGLSCMLPSLTLKWDVAESLLQVRHETALHNTTLRNTILPCTAPASVTSIPLPLAHPFITTITPHCVVSQHCTGSETITPHRVVSQRCTGTKTSGDPGGRQEFPYGDFKFDCIITDPPYGMAEAVQSRTSSTSTPGDDDADESGAASSSSSSSSSSSVDAVRGAVSTLLQLANDRLSEGGRLVFFAPHRQIGASRDRGKSNILVTEVGSGSASYGGPGVSVEGDLNSVGGMESKMAKRKSFKKRTNVSLQLEVEAEEKRTVEGVEAIGDYEADSLDKESAPRRDVTGPLDFLPPLPKGLILIGYHQQIMSPTFSRWLCVLQKQKQK